MTARETAVKKAISIARPRNGVVDIYNTYTPRPRGYKVKYSDQICATYVSAIFIALGWTDIVPPECGAHQLYQNMAKIGHGVQDRNRVPEPGDLIFFGNSKYVTGIQHVGIVTSVKNGKQIYYYDAAASIRQHTLPVGHHSIWGYGIPDYVAKEKPKEEIKMEVKVQFSAFVKSETADKINAMAKRTGKDAGSIIDSLVEKGSM